MRALTEKERLLISGGTDSSTTNEPDDGWQFPTYIDSGMGTCIPVEADVGLQGVYFGFSVSPYSLLSPELAGLTVWFVADLTQSAQNQWLTVMNQFYGWRQQTLGW